MHRTVLDPLTPFLDIGLVPPCTLLSRRLLIQHFLVGFQHGSHTAFFLLRLRGLQSHQACLCPTNVFPPPVAEQHVAPRHISSQLVAFFLRSSTFSSSILTASSPSSDVGVNRPYRRREGVTVCTIWPPPLSSINHTSFQTESTGHALPCRILASLPHAVSVVLLQSRDEFAGVITFESPSSGLAHPPDSFA